MGLDATRFDLGEIENLVDQGQEVPSSGMNRRRPLWLLVAEVSVLVRRQHLRKDHHAVERRADFMGHVRQELRLVARLLRLRFERRDRLCDLPLSGLELEGTLLELFPSPVELYVGSLQLLEELLGAHARTD